MPLRSRYFKKVGFRGNPGVAKAINRMEPAIIRSAAIALLAVCVIIAGRALLFPRRAADFPLQNVAALQIPAKTMLDLRELSVKYVIDFPELLTLYCFENNFFPEKSAAPSFPELETNFIRNYDSIKRSYSEKAIQSYARMFEAVLTGIECFPIPKDNITGTGTDIDYMYGDSWDASANRLIGGSLFAGTDIFDRENIKGRIPVVSVSAGTVTRMGYSDASGYTASVETDKGVTFTYAHLDSFTENLTKGAKVSPGQLIGQMGGSGNMRNASASGQVALRFGISVSGTKFGNLFGLNPYPFLYINEDNKIEYLNGFGRQNHGRSKYGDGDVNVNNITVKQ